MAAESSHWGAILGSVVVLGNLGYFAVHGFLERRPYWTRKSWWRFGFVCALGGLLLATSFAMTSIDNEVLKAAVKTADGRSYFFLALLACMFTGLITLYCVLYWFGTGDPQQQFFGVEDKVAEPAEGAR